MKKLLRFLGWSLAAIAGLALVAYAIAWGVAKSRYEKEWAAHEEVFPIPFPLGDAELAALREERIAAGASADDPLSGVNLDAIALERAVARGRRLVETRAGCNGCHREDFGGGELVDELIVGRWVAPNLTTGKGSVTLEYTAADWDHAVRHGLRANGRTSVMPTVEFTNLSDRELSDIVAYVRSMPPVDRNLPGTRLGPILAFILAAKPDWIATYDIDHRKAHDREPPQSSPTAAYGRHLAQVCRGCHGPGLSGGKIKGDPGGTVYPNLTPHETGIGDWSEADFFRAMREGKRPDGSALSEEMPFEQFGLMSDEELRAIYEYLRSLRPTPKGNR